MASRYKYALMSATEDGETDLSVAEQRRSCDKNMFLKVMVALLLVVIAVLLGILQWRWSRNENEQVCLSPECVDISSYIMNKMNLSADPCKDFYNYACGGWEKTTLIPPEYAKFDTFAEVNAYNMGIIKKILENRSAMLKGQNSSAVDKVKRYYQTCMDEKKIELDGSEPLHKIIDKLGSWSVLNNYIQPSWNLEEMLIQHNKLGFSPLFIIDVEVDMKNSSRYVVVFSQGGLTLDSSEEYGADVEKYHHAFLEFGVTVGRLLGGDNSTHQKMEAIYQFEKRIAESFVPKEDLIDPQSKYNLMNLTELQGMFGLQLNVTRFMADIMNQTVDPSYEVVVVTKDYFPRLQKVLSETDPQVVQDYMIFHLVQAIPGYLPQSFANAAMGINKVEFGISDLPPRWKRCISKAESAFGFAVSALYVEERFPPESKAQAYEIVSAVRSAFIANLDNVSWMDQKTLQTAKIKAQTADIQLGYPDWILNVTKLDKEYEMVKVTEGSFLDNFFSVSQAATLNTWSRLGTVPDTDKWILKPHQVNAVFRSSYNELVILAGLLQRPFFDPRYPLSYKYGSTGSISGHELSHGFDDNGRKYDQHGNLNEWWSPSASQAFSEHTSCLVEEYSQFSIYGKHVNGKYTLGENIADNGGLKMAYAAYMNQRDGQPELQLPGLSLTPEQLYFLGFAQIWCSHYTPEYAIHSILTDEHVISRFRVLGSVANSAAFSKAYECPAASPLNPINKCQVW